MRERWCAWKNSGLEVVRVVRLREADLGGAWLVRPCERFRPALVAGRALCGKGFWFESF
jgi:hypothetical protein